LQGGAALSVLLKRESQGDFAADYCFDAIVSKISASTTVGVPSLSAPSRTRNVGDEMRVRTQRQVWISALGMRVLSVLRGMRVRSCGPTLQLWITL